MSDHRNGDAVAACADLASRAGALGFEIGHNAEDDTPPDALAAADHHWADVLAVVPQPRRDVLRRHLAALTEYERRINWMTTCEGCADRLDADYAQTMHVEDAAIRGYRRAVATLGDVARRTDSPAARWAVEYLTTDPDRLAPAGWREARGSDDD